jgi:hypothetical protein
LKKEAKEITIPKNKFEKFLTAMETVADNIQLAMEDAPYKNMLESIFGEEDNEARQNVIARSRDTYKRFPLYKQAINLDKCFVLGNGVQRPISSNPYIQYIIDSIWDARENKRTFTGYKAMGKIISQRAIIGELFFKIYINEETGENVVRVEANTDNITDVITRPGDKDSIRFYKYTTIETGWDFENNKPKQPRKKTMYIPDIYNEDLEEILLRGAYDKKNKVRMWGFLVSFGNEAEKSNLRGWPVYQQSLKWVNAHKEVAADSASMLKAKSRYAWNVKFPNGVSSNIANAIMETAKSLTADGEINSATPAVASDLYTNEKLLKKEPIDIKHDAGAFEGTSKILMQAISSGTGKSEHYFGNPSNANLATATSMELPMLKFFQSIQQEFAEMYEEIFKFLILQIIMAKKPEIIIKETTAEDYDVPTDTKILAQMKKDLTNASWEGLDTALFMPDLIDKDAAMISAVNNAIVNGTIDEREGAKYIYSIMKTRNIDNLISDQFGDDYDAGEEDNAEGDMDAETERVKALAKQKEKPV